jgi:hypothetical protein
MATRETWWIALGAGVLAITTTLGVIAARRGPLRALERTFRERASDPAPLLDGLLSYATVAEVEKQLTARHLPFTTETDANPEAPSLPGYEFVTIRVPSYPYARQRGELDLGFFNDRLMDARFQPTGAPGGPALAFARKEREEISGARGAQFVDVDEITSQSRRVTLRIRDSRLARELSEWLGRHPAPR